VSLRSPVEDFPGVAAKHSTHRRRLTGRVVTSHQAHGAGDDVMTKEVHRPKDGAKTPGGGVVAEVYYLDGEGEPVEKERAARVVIRELDENGNLVSETFGMVESIADGRHWNRSGSRRDSRRASSSPQPSWWRARGSSS